jgi:predicted nucleic acid-binding protein
MDADGLTTVLFDTSAAIYFLELPAGDQRHEAIKALVRRAEQGRMRIIMSTVSFTELLVGPIKRSDAVGEANVVLFSSRLCELAAVGPTTAYVAATLRARHGLRTPDALILATAIEHGVDAVIGNDAAWKRVGELRFLHVDALLAP